MTNIIEDLEICESFLKDIENKHREIGYDIEFARNIINRNIVKLKEFFEVEEEEEGGV